MGFIREPEGVDFEISQAMTEEDTKIVSAYIKKSKEKREKRKKTEKKLFNHNK